MNYFITKAINLYFCSWHHRHRPVAHILQCTVYVLKIMKIGWQ